MPFFSKIKNLIFRSNINAQTVRLGDDYHYYGDKKIKKMLGLLPFFPEVFVGRDDDLKKVHWKLFQESHLLLLVNGEGGMGKTSLAAVYYRKYQDDYKHLAWVFAEKNLLNALLVLAVSLEIEFPKEMSNEKRFDVLLNAIQNLDKPCLLVIDNLNSVSELGQYYKALRSCPNFHLLITTRITEFHQAAFYKIEPLEKQIALQLFATYYPKHQANEDELLSLILTAVGYNTLVIELLAKNLYLFNRLKTKYSLGDLFDDLQKRGLLSLSKTQTVQTDYHAKGTALRQERPEDIIAAMYDLSELNDTERYLLAVFAILPAENIAFVILETLFPDNENIEDPLLSLAQKGWLDYNQIDASFKVSPVIQEVTIKKNTQLATDTLSFVGKLTERLLYEPFTGNLVHLENAYIYARYAESVHKIIQHSHGLADRLGNYHKITGNLKQALLFYQESLEDVQHAYMVSRQSNDAKSGLAIAHQNLGVLYNLLGDLKQVKIHYEEYHFLAKELYDIDKKKEEYVHIFAISYQFLGNLYSSLGNIDQSLQLYQRYLDLKKELYDANPQSEQTKNGLAIAYSKMSDIYRSFGNLKNALSFCELSFSLRKELSDANPKNAAIKHGLSLSYQHLGRMHTLFDNLPKALFFYQKNHNLSEELHKDDFQNLNFKHGLSLSYQHLGVTYCSMKDLNQALVLYKESYSWAEQIYNIEPQNTLFKKSLAIACERLGDVYELLNDLETALTWFEKELLLFDELYQMEPKNTLFQVGLGWAHQFLGIVHDKMGHSTQSYQFYERMLSVFKKLYDLDSEHVDYCNGLALAYQNIGKHQEKNQDYKNAASYYELSKRLFEQLVKRTPNYSEFKKNLDSIENRLEKIRLH